MQVSWLLRKVLKDHDLDKYGVLLRISKEAQIHRTIVSNIYNDKAPSVSMATLAKLCRWLRENGAREGLPGSLFGESPSDLWRALAALKDVTIYLGEYQFLDPGVPTFRWVSRRDADVAAKIIERISDNSAVGTSQPHLQMRYAPFHKAKGSQFRRTETFDDDVKKAATIFRQTKHSTSSSSVFIGSPQVNYLVEHFVADLFHCRPFKSNGIEPVVPFYRGYRSNDQDFPSCMAGRDRPGHKTRTAEAGIYYRTTKGQWDLLPWRDRHEDAAIVITTFDPATRAFRLAIFGYSGLGTAAAGTRLAQKPDLFWKEPDRTSKRFEVAVDIFRVAFANSGSSDRDADPAVKSFERVRRIVV